MSPSCAKCGRPHDLDKAPDEGICLACGGPLLDAGERHDPERYQNLTLDVLARVQAAKPSRGEPN